MEKFTPTHVHKETIETFQLITKGAETGVFKDRYGSHDCCDLDKMTLLQPVEEWEPVPHNCGLVFLGVEKGWVNLPHPDVRIVDGCRLERRKL